MITATDLCFSYSNAVPYVLEHLDLDIGRGEYVSVVGDNGSGKSTLVKLMLRLLKPSRGTIRCDARRIGYVPQKNDFSNAQFPITVRELLDSYRRLIHLRDRRAVEETLLRVRMEDCRARLVGSLSGGQLQRVLIARALLGQPDLLVLDEPSSGVDRKSQDELYPLLQELNRTEGITVVSVEHNLDAALANSTLIYHLTEGRGHLCSPEAYAQELLHR